MIQIVRPGPCKPLNAFRPRGTGLVIQDLVTGKTNPLITIPAVLPIGSYRITSIGIVGGVIDRYRIAGGPFRISNAGNLAVGRVIAHRCCNISSIGVKRT